MKESDLSKAEYREASERMLSMIAAFLGATDSFPDVSEDELRALYVVSKDHGLCALTAAALRKIGICNSTFNIALAKAQRKSLLFDKELETLERLLKQNGIRMIPLKGMVLKSLYPGTGLREMSDIDILFDRSFSEEVRRIMVENGYEVFLYNKSNHDVYQKRPFFNVEMHRALFDEAVFTKFAQYFDEKTDLLWRDTDEPPIMSIDMTYLYLIAHAYVHYSISGIGLRILIDLNLFLKEHIVEMDFPFISNELAKIDLGEFEDELRHSALSLFDPKKVSDISDKYITSGLYGSYRLLIEKRIKRKTHSSRHWKLSYYAQRLRPSKRDIRNSRFFSKHPTLSRLIVITKPVKALFTQPRKVIREIKEVSRYKYSDKQ